MMPTDRELLEAAALAAGIVIDKSPFNGGGRANTGFDLLGNAVLDWHNGTKWNPLTRDGDAFRLAVQLRIQVTPGTYNREEVTAFADTGPAVYEYPRLHQDAAASTRRAIVRAAAAMAPPAG